MSEPSSLVFEVEGLTKQYGGLRPLRLRSLTVAREAIVAIAGLDAPAAEMLVNLLTGATLPETGQVRIFGRNTADITDADDWLQSLDRFGIVSDRAVLLEELTVAQNLAMTLTLEVDPLPDATRRAVERIAHDAGLSPALLDRKVATLGPVEKLLVRLGRAIALDPAVLLLEHPTATLPVEAVPAFAEAITRLAGARALTVLALTADTRFASAITPAPVTLVPADGTLVPLHSAPWDRVKRLFGG